MVWEVLKILFLDLHSAPMVLSNRLKNIYIWKENKNKFAVVLQLWRPDLNANHSINRVNGSLLSYYTHFIKHLRQVNSRIVGLVFSVLWILVIK